MLKSLSPKVAMPKVGLPNVLKSKAKPAAAKDGSGARDTKGGLSRLFLFRKPKTNAAMRRHKRHACCVIATLKIIERDIELEGLVMELSLGGALFRQASTYILFREGEDVILSLGGRSAPGVLVATRPTGYGVKLSEELPEDFVEEIVARFGMPTDAFGQPRAA